MNPEKMRSTYGKLIYMLQDSQIHDVKEMLGFSMVSDIFTVHKFLSDSGENGSGLKVCKYMIFLTSEYSYPDLNIVEDDLIVTATMEILSEGRSRREVQSDIKRKERAIEILARKYSSPKVCIRAHD